MHHGKYITTKYPNKIDVSRSRAAREEVLSNRYFRIAHAEMKKSIHKSRFGATLVLKNGKFFSSHNKDNKTHPMLKKHYPDFAISVHAELQVLMNTNPFRYEDDLEGSKMYVYREDRHGLIKPARPCKYCESIMVDYGVKKVCYTTLYGWECEIL